MAIDLGTANTLVYVAGRGVVASDVDTGLVHAVGSEAERMIGRTPATISATRPLRHGVIADFEVTEEMLRYFIRKVLNRRMAHPRLIVCAPSGVTEVEKRAVEEASLAAGARRVHLIEGGYEMDDAITHYLRNRYKLAVGSRTAESIKISIGSVTPLQEEMSIDVRGRHLISGLPTAVPLRSEEVREAIRLPVQEILQAIRDTLEECPPELASDVAKDGILLAGGGTLIRGLPELVSRETGMPVFRADSPLTCVAIGSGQALDHIDHLSAMARRRRLETTPDWRTA